MCKKLLFVISDRVNTRVNFNVTKYEVYYTQYQTSRSRRVMDDDRYAAELFYYIVNYYRKDFDLFVLLDFDPRVIHIAENIRANYVDELFFSERVRLLHLRSPHTLTVMIDDEIVGEFIVVPPGFKPIFKLIVLPEGEYDRFMRDILSRGFPYDNVYKIIKVVRRKYYYFILMQKQDLTGRLRALVGVQEEGCV